MFFSISATQCLNPADSNRDRPESAIQGCSTRPDRSLNHFSYRSVYWGFIYLTAISVVTFIVRFAVFLGLSLVCYEPLKQVFKFHKPVFSFVLVDKPKWLNSFASRRNPLKTTTFQTIYNSKNKGRPLCSIGSKRRTKPRRKRTLSSLKETPRTRSCMTAKGLVYLHDNANIRKGFWVALTCACSLYLV